MTREEAIKVAYGIPVTKAQHEALQFLVPELAEWSEDERIRKALIDALKTSKSVGELKFILPEPTREECIAYLEKQKDLTTENIYKHSRERMSFWNGQQKEQKPVDLSEMMVHKEPYIAPVPTPMVADEQKSDWSEEDEKSFNNALSGLKYAYEDLINHKSFDSAEDVKNAFDWLKSLRPQPKQEWQIKKGDKVSIHCRKDREKDIIAIYDGKVGKVTHVSDKRYPWGHIDVKLDNGCNNSFHEDELEVLDEPHWKPSDEQMSALEECGECKRCVKELREQIKKL